MSIIYLTSSTLAEMLHCLKITHLSDECVGYVQVSSRLSMLFGSLPYTKIYSSIGTKKSSDEYVFCKTVSALS